MADTIEEFRFHFMSDTIEKFSDFTLWHNHSLLLPVMSPDAHEVDQRTESVHTYSTWRPNVHITVVSKAAEVEATLHTS